MELVLFRHGVATPRETHEGPDAARELTEHGRFKTRSAARGLQSLGCEPQVVVASPLLRARQTAEIVAEVLGVRRAIEIIDELTPGTLTSQVIKKLDAINVGAMVVVGHAPDLDLLLRGLLDGGVGPMTALKKAAAACVACPSPGARQGELRWLLPPRTLRVLGKEEDSMAGKAVVFDLDGTLVDSLEDIARAMNRALGQRGWPQHPVATYRRLVGEGMLRLAAQVAPEGSETSGLIDDYQAEYAAAIDRATRPYPGVLELLAALAERRVATAVLTNKPHELALKLIKRVLPDAAFVAVRGQKTGQRRKPSPEPLLELMPVLGVSLDEVMLVGDTAVDIATARAAGVRSVGVSWGFRPEEIGSADLVIDHPADLLASL